MRRPWLYFIWTLAFFPNFGYGQDCNIMSKANDIDPDQLCSPVQVVTWEVSYVGVNHAGTLVEIYFDWDDGDTETITATELDAATSEWGAISSHTYTSNDDICNHRPIATLVVNGVMCTSSAQEQIVTVWDNDNTNGGRVNASPDVYPICFGSGATMQFIDATLFNCVPPQEEDVPNDRTRWIQWVYGTSNSMTGAPVLIDGVAVTFPDTGNVIELTGPVTGSDEVSLPITVADDKLIGQEFEVELRYWNYCNPYPTHEPVIDRSVIRIVDIPDATITPLDTLCEYQANLFLTAATDGGTWSGNGIVDPATGEFSPSLAGNGTHTITYEVTDDNSCSSMDTEDIVVRPGPDGTITPAGPFCSYDPPYDLVAASVSGTWSGNGIINSSTGLFDPVVAGPGRHIISFETVPDANGCVGIDTVELEVMAPPYAEFLSSDSAWCETENNQSVGEILISGSESSSFDLVLDIGDDRDTLRNLSEGVYSLPLNNQAGRNSYSLVKIIEHHGNISCETDLSDNLLMEVFSMPVMELSAIYNDLCSPVVVDFETVAGYHSYSWDFGDGNLHITPYNQVSYTYSYDYRDEIIEIQGGDTIYGPLKTDTTFYIKLIAETDFGCIDSLTDSIRIYPSPDADFFVNPQIQDYPGTEIQLINLTTPGPWSYDWDFGDGTSDTQKDPDQHIYDSWGLYEVELTAFSPYCRDSISKQIQITPPPPEAIFQPDTMGCPPLDITFRNQSKYADSFVWNFDDGIFSTEASPTHRFVISKEHRVILTAYGPTGVDSTEQIILVHPQPQAVFDAYPREAKNLKQLIKFDNNSINATSYKWDFGDGHSSEDEYPSHTYKEPGIFTVSLYVWSEHGCPDTLVKEKLVNVLDGEGSTVFPNAFRWNESGPTGGNWGENELDNTIFHPHMDNAVELYMIVYTRWGEKIWETDNIYIGWDGYLNSGELVPPGVYIYKAWITYGDGTKELLAGDVTFFH
ncbi:MAG: PKD domain-containing protein [Bacteroidota bacterium]|nr:PKD domain-containing protein [Bacteroidota bacterium]